MFNLVTHINCERQVRIRPGYFFSVNPGGYHNQLTSELMIENAAMLSIVRQDKFHFQTGPEPHDTAACRDENAG